MTTETRQHHRNTFIVSLSASLFGLALVVITNGCASTSQTAADPTLLTQETTPLPPKSDRVKLTRLGPNEFNVTCDKIESVAAKQRGTNWCWAACAEMIFRYNGIRLSQEDIIKLMKQSSEADTQEAGLFEVWLAMNPDIVQEIARRKAAWRSNDPKTIQVNANMNVSNLGDVINSMTDPSTDELVQEISAGNPVVIGLHGGQWGDGHIVLAYEVDYSRLKPKGNVDYLDLSNSLFRFRHRFQVNKVKIIDPSPLPGQSQTIEIGSEEFKASKDFTVGKANARKQLESYMKVHLPTPEEMQAGRPVK